MTDKNDYPSDTSEGQAAESHLDITSMPKEPRNHVRETLAVADETMAKDAFMDTLKTCFENTRTAMLSADQKSDSDKDKNQGRIRISDDKIPPAKAITLKRIKAAEWLDHGNVEVWLASGNNNLYIAIPERDLAQSDGDLLIEANGRSKNIATVDQSVLQSGLLPLLPGFTWFLTGPKEEMDSILQTSGWKIRSGKGTTNLESEESNRIANEAILDAEHGLWNNFVLAITCIKGLPSEELMLSIRHYATYLVVNEKWRENSDLRSRIKPHLEKIEWFADIARAL